MNMLAKKLLAFHRKNDEEIRIADIAHGFATHDYPLSRTEARELLGEGQVPHPDPEEMDLTWELFCGFAEEMKLRENFNPEAVFNEPVDNNQPQGMIQVSLQLARIESSTRSSVLERKLRITRSPL